MNRRNLIHNQINITVESFVHNVQSFQTHLNDGERIAGVKEAIQNRTGINNWNRYEIRGTPRNEVDDRKLEDDEILSDLFAGTGTVFLIKINRRAEARVHQALCNIKSAVISVCLCSSCCRKPIDERFPQNNSIVELPVDGAVNRKKRKRVVEKERNQKPIVAINKRQTLIVRGVATGKKFDVNLATGPAVDGYSGDNIALHISWRQTEKAVVLNSYENGQWKKEERHKDAGLKENEPFDLRVRAHDDRFELFLQHKKLADFQYRLPVNTISHLFVSGELRLQALAWEGNYYPIPYKGGIPGNFGPVRKLLVTGVPEKDAKKFEINLYAAGDIALHFNPRFSDKVVVRNSQQGGNWGNEEREGGFPFAKEKQFDLVIVSEGDALQAYVNGEHHSTFRNRIQAHQIDGLGIEGDLQLQAIAFD